jgi:hypothetical protein
MSMDYNQYRLKYLKEKQKIREEKEKQKIREEKEKQKIREEKEAYEEAFYKLSNEEQIIIRKVEAELIQVHKMDCLNKYKLKLEQREKEEIKREKEEIKRLTKLIEDYRQITRLTRATGVVCVLAYVGLTIITR